MVELHLLGRFSVVVNGRPLSGEAAQKRRLAILPLLVGSDMRPVTRDRLIGVLWPDHDPESARHLLSAGIHVLRRALGAETIISRGDELALDPVLVRADVIAFRAAAGAGDAEEALRLYRGPYLDGFHVSGGADFEQWVDGERDELARLYAQALEHAAAERTRRGAAEPALEAWRQRAALDPYDARIALSLMHALVDAGQRAAAIRHAHVHSVLLEQELGAAPDADVTSYAEALRVATEGRSNGGATPAAPAEPAGVPALPTAAALPEVRTVSAVAAEPGSRASATTRVRTPPPRWRRYVGPAFVAALLGIVALWGRVVVPNPVRVIAVVPLHTAPGQEHIGQGIADRVIYELRELEGIEVKSRDASFRYAGESPDRIIRELDVDAVVTGRIDVAEDGQVEVWIEMVRADGLPVFSDHFDASRMDGVEHLVRIAMVHELGLDVRRAAPAPAPQAPNAAIEEYWRGEQAWYRRTPGALDSALRHFRNAAAIDSSYALAWAGIAAALSMLASYDYGALPPDSAFPAARDAAQRALRLDPKLARAHALLANISANFDWQWQRAEAGYQRALELDPGLASAHQWLSLLLATERRFDEAIDHALRATEAEPGSAITFVNYAHVLYYRRDFTAARARIDEALRLDPSFNRAHVLTALTDLAEQKYEPAMQRLEALRRAGADEPVLLALLAAAHAQHGDHDRARALLYELEQRRRSRYVPAELDALVHLSLGDRDRAMAALERARARRSGGIAYLEVEPLLDPIREDPRFIALVRETRGRLPADAAR